MKKFETKAGMVVARRGNQRAEFTEFIWKNMGKRKEGWVAVTEDGKKKNKKAKEDVAETSDFKKLIERAKGLVTDGLLAKGLEVYLEAQVIKDGKPIQKKIKQLKALIAAEDSAGDDEAYKELIATAEGLVKDDELEDAVEAYKQAQELKDSEELQKIIADLEAQAL